MSAGAARARARRQGLRTGGGRGPPRVHAVRAHGCGALGYGLCRCGRRNRARGGGVHLARSVRAGAGARRVPCPGLPGCAHRELRGACGVAEGCGRGRGPGAEHGGRGIARQRLDREGSCGDRAGDRLRGAGAQRHAAGRSAAIRGAMRGRRRGLCAARSGPDPAHLQDCADRRGSPGPGRPGGATAHHARGAGHRAAAADRAGGGLMHIRTLDLRAFGPFTDKVLQFGETGTGLHLLYGPNEAGKSSALQALGDFFFGIHPQTPYNFLHDYKKLAINAELGINGRVVTATRYKRTKNDLVDAANQPIDEEWWRRAVLGGFERTFFGQMFAIGHETLREGTRGLLEGGGALGETLFAAASGIANLRTVLEELDKERDAIFKKNGQVQPVAVLTNAIHALQKEQQEVIASADEYAERQASLKALQRKRDEAAEQLEEFGMEVARLQRRLSAMELSVRRRRLLEELAAFAEVRTLPEDFRERRVVAENALQTAADRMLEAQERRERIEESLGAIIVDAGVQDEAAAIEALRMELAQHVKAMADTKALEQERDRIAYSVRELLDSLGGGLSPEDAAARRLPRAERNRITTLAEQRQALIATEESANEARTEARTALSRAEDALTAAAMPCDTTELVAGLDLAANHGDIESRIAELSRRIKDERRRIAENFARLALRGLGGTVAPTVDDLPAMPLPAADTVQQFDTALTEAENALRREEDEVARVTNELDGKRRELERVRRGGDLPSHEDLEAARRLRDASWDLIRRRWVDNDRKEADVWRLLDELREVGIDAPRPDSISRALADGFKEAMERADSVADALWQGARQLAVVLELEAEAERLGDELCAAQSRRDDVAEALEQLRVQWTDVWQPAGIAAGRPREMASVLQRAVSLRDRLAALRDEELAFSGLTEERDRIRTLLERGLEQAGVAGAPDHTITALVARARHVVDEAAELGRTRRTFEETISTNKAALTASEGKAKCASEDMAAWRREWAAAVAPLGLGADASTDEVRAYVEAIESACVKLADAADKTRRIDSMREDFEDYAARVRAVAERVAPDFARETAVETMILELSRRRKESAEAAAERKRLEEQRGDAAAEYESASRARETAEKQLAVLVGEAGCNEVRELPNLEEQSRRKLELERELAALERELAVHAGGEALERFIEDTLALDRDQLAGRLEQARSEQSALNDSRDEYLRKITLAEGELAAMQGESKAAEIRQQIAAEAARLQDVVDRYVRLTIAAQALRKEMERYRRDNQGPVLQAAGAYFQTMTRGSFRGLEADYDEKGDPVLTGVRPDGEKIGVPAMSDGSRDQLYLALRLGALDGFLGRNEPLPFIVDDVLVHFDDARSESTLAVLAELARRTQVIFFTHHEHLVGLARNAVPAELLSVQEL
ncbi:hypothetical protein E8L03_10990 [Oceanidesulfovibrio marinus]|uniref:YhaN AAA domain-containing protein n=2 Tax=Oceanidesulfovibrio marinus TaxID=370038 RepID=A0ABX6NFP3_9BACT|nr:hypothetical protein E8L03_10990 [Oceanidesulfovibrio marinus]